MTRASSSRRAGKAVLPIIAGLFLASGLIRLGDGTAQALTEELRRGADHAAELRAARGEVCAPPPDVAVVLEALKARAATLDSREAEMTDRAATLAIAEEEIARQMRALETAEASLRATLTLADEAAENDIARLTAVYENMKPEQAAGLFAQMDPAFAAGFLGRMRTDAAAAVLAGLDPQTAYSISAILAGRNARAPKE